MSMQYSSNRVYTTSSTSVEQSQTENQFRGEQSRRKKLYDRSRFNKKVAGRSRKYQAFGNQTDEYDQVPVQVYHKETVYDSSRIASNPSHLIAQPLKKLKIDEVAAPGVSRKEEKDKDGNTIITETQIVEEVQDPAHAQPHPQGPSVKKTKTKDGWIEETTTYETVEMNSGQDSHQGNSHGWSLTHTGRGWDQFQKKSASK